jgi:mannonate dehydratase
MYKVMKLLRQIEFDGVVIPDHVPTMAGDPRLGTAYTIGYMKALLQRANEEVAAERQTA